MSNNKTIWIGNDHGGYEMKKFFVDHLMKKNYKVVDVGSNSTQIVRYPHYAAKVASAVSRGEADCGILICSTGIGMSIIANKFDNIRASLCTTSYMGKMTRAHNDSNILCLGGKTTGIYEALDILENWLNTDYEGGRHNISLSLIREAEGQMRNDVLWDPEIPKEEKMG